MLFEQLIAKSFIVCLGLFFYNYRWFFI